MANPFIKVQDSDSLVCSVSKVSVGEGAGCTEYQEAYNGSFMWNTEEVNVYRHGEGDYKLTPPA